MTDPKSFPPRQVWATARDGQLGELSSIATPLLRKGEPVAYVGGKLAAALIRPLENAKFPPVLSDRRHPVLTDIPPEDAEYEAFGHGYGEVHTAREFRQLVERAARTFAPAEDRWRADGRVIDPFRPGLRYAAVSDQEFDALQERHLNAVRTTFRRAKTLVVALSQSEVWESRADGAVFPRWTTAAEQHFDPDKHAVRTLTVEETVLDLAAAAKALRALNPGLAIVLMVSPEPQLATTHPAHVLVAGAVGKAVLRIAMEAVCGTEGVAYFPALEIAELRAPISAYGADGAIPAAVIVTIVEALVAISEDGATAFAGPAAPVPVLRTMPAEPRAPKRPKPAADTPPQGLVEAAPLPVAAEPARKAKAKPPTVSVVDPYRQAKEVEAREKAERRAAHLAAMGQAAPSTEEPTKPTLSQAERQVLRREKAQAREARLATAAAIPPEQAEASAAARRKREEARAAAAAAASAQPEAPSADAAEPSKPRRKEKKARIKSDPATKAISGDTGQAKSKPRRERQRAAKRREPRAPSRASPS